MLVMPYFLSLYTRLSRILNLRSAIGCEMNSEMKFPWNTRVRFVWLISQFTSPVRREIAHMNTCLVWSMIYQERTVMIYVGVCCFKRLIKATNLTYSCASAYTFHMRSGSLTSLKTTTTAWNPLPNASDTGAPSPPLLVHAPLPVAYFIWKEVCGIYSYSQPFGGAPAWACVLQGHSISLVALACLAELLNEVQVDYDAVWKCNLSPSVYTQ